MKRLIFILLFSVLITAVIIIRYSLFPEYSNNHKTEIIKLNTIVCGTCVDNVSYALKQDSGIIDFDVSLKTKSASVKFDKAKTSLQTIENYIVKSGYDANDRIADSNAYRELSNCCKIWGDDPDYMKLREGQKQGCKGGCCFN
ncbi:MAG: cation transporter [Chlorobi bacterium]|nr:cation transporter [Chlorobiota bacterium]MCI0715505.1 cation transporter [Chlorobiota bacterium]